MIIRVSSVAHINAEIFYENQCCFKGTRGVFGTAGGYRFCKWKCMSPT